MASTTPAVWRYGQVKLFWQKDNGGDLVETAHHAGAALRPPVLHRRFARRASLAARIDKLWREVDWNFYRQNGQNRAEALESGNTAGK